MYLYSPKLSKVSFQETFYSRPIHPCNGTLFSPCAGNTSYIRKLACIHITLVAISATNQEALRVFENHSSTSRAHVRDLGPFPRLGTLTGTYHGEPREQSRGSAGSLQLGSTQVEFSPRQRLHGVLAQTHCRALLGVLAKEVNVCLMASNSAASPRFWSCVGNEKQAWKVIPPPPISKRAA